MIKVIVSDDYAHLGVAVCVVNEVDNGMNGRVRYILRYGESGYLSWEEIPPDGVTNRPTLTFEDDIARALYDALARHYQGSDDTRALRKDYDAERKRADNLIATVTNLATTAITSLAPPPGLAEWDR